WWEHGVGGIIEPIDLPHGVLLRHGAGSLRRDDRGSVRHGIRDRLGPRRTWIAGSTLPDGRALEMEAYDSAQELSDIEFGGGDSKPAWSVCESHCIRWKTRRDSNLVSLVFAAGRPDCRLVRRASWPRF